MHMGDATGLLRFQEFQQHIDRTNHGATLAIRRGGCNRWICGQSFSLPESGNGCIFRRPAGQDAFFQFPMFNRFNPYAGLSAPSWYSAPRLWRTLKKASISAGRKTLLTALTLFYCLQDRDTPTWAKGVIVGALGYLVLPTDLIPDIIPGAGYGDEWGALVAALGAVAAYIKDEHKAKAEAQVTRLFGVANPPPPLEFIE